MNKMLKLAVAARKRKKEAKHDRLLKRLGMESNSEYKARKKDEMDIDYEDTPLESKQKFLDLFNNKTPLGEAAKQAGITVEIASQVIIRNAVGYIPVKAIK